MPVVAKIFLEDGSRYADFQVYSLECVVSELYSFGRLHGRKASLVMVDHNAILLIGSS